MEYSGLLFVYCLLPLIVAGYFLIPDVGRRNIYLIAVGLFLYFLAQPLFLPLIVFLCWANYKLALKIKRGKKKTLIFPVVMNLGVLMILKYADPLLSIAGIGTESGGVLLGAVGWIVGKLNGLGMSLAVPVSIAPVGISFLMLTFISYLSDVYFGKTPAERDFQAFLLHCMLFFKLFQGPVLRYEANCAQLKERRQNYHSIFDGVMRFVTGLGKKVLIADLCGRMIQDLESAGSDHALIGIWLSAVLVLFRIYFDFSGCCDMAIGLGKIFGFKLPENFNLPFTAMSVTNFLERWNLTVRSFFVDYVYTPLCGKKKNSMIAAGVTILLACLWHGGTLNFWILGVLLGIVLLVESQFQDFMTDLPYWLRHILTVLLLLLAAVLFVNPDSASIADALKAMIGEGGLHVAGDGRRVLYSIPVIGLCWFGVSDEPRKLRLRWKIFCGISRKGKKEPVHPVMEKVYAGSCCVYILVILWLCLIVRSVTAVVPSVFLNL